MQQGLSTPAPSVSSDCSVQQKRRSLSLAVRKQYVPEGIQEPDFHERLDGHQNVILMFYSRDLLPCIARPLLCPQSSHTLHTRFRPGLVKDKDGVRIIGAYNTGDWYEFAHPLAQSKGCGRHVTGVPLFGSTDV